MFDCLFNLANNILLFYKSTDCHYYLRRGGRLNKTKNNFNKYFCSKSINLADLF